MRDVVRPIRGFMVADIQYFLGLVLERDQIAGPFGHLGGNHAVVEGERKIIFRDLHGRKISGSQEPGQQEPEGEDNQMLQIHAVNTNPDAQTRLAVTI